PRRDRVDVDGAGLLALEPEQDGLVAAVSLAGQAQGPVQADAHRLDPRHEAVGAEALGEHPGRLHRPDGMRTRRADADLEQIEDADRHAGLHRRRSSVEDYGPVAVEQYAMLRVPGHRARQDLGLDVAAGLG